MLKWRIALTPENLTPVDWSALYVVPTLIKGQMRGKARMTLQGNAVFHYKHGMGHWACLWKLLHSATYLVHLGAPSLVTNQTLWVKVPKRRCPIPICSAMQWPGRPATNRGGRSSSCRTQHTGKRHPKMTPNLHFLIPASKLPKWTQNCNAPILFDKHPLRLGR